MTSFIGWKPDIAFIGAPAVPVATATTAASTTTRIEMKMAQCVLRLGFSASFDMYLG